MEAIGLYRSAGFVKVSAFNDEPFAHHWFEKQLLRPLRLSRPLPGRSCVLTTSLRAQPPPNSAVLGRVARGLRGGRSPGLHGAGGAHDALGDVAELPALSCGQGCQDQLPDD